MWVKGMPHVPNPVSRPISAVNFPTTCSVIEIIAKRTVVRAIIPGSTSVPLDYPEPSLHIAHVFFLQFCYMLGGTKQQHIIKSSIMWNDGSGRCHPTGNAGARKSPALFYAEASWLCELNRMSGTIPSWTFGNHRRKPETNIPKQSIPKKKRWEDVGKKPTLDAKQKKQLQFSS